MITEKKLILKPILESSKGIHLTAYLVNRGDLIDLKSQLQETIIEANEFLYPILNIEERNKFFEPIDALLNDARILKNMKGNIGLFRTKNFFRVINVPVEVERQCHVASSFHVKPLLRWMQFDRDFLLLGLKQDSAHLYLGSQTYFKKIDSMLFCEKADVIKTFRIKESLKSSRQMCQNLEAKLSWLREWVNQITYGASPRLFLAGDKKLVEEIQQSLKYKNIQKSQIAFNFDDHNVSHTVSLIRQQLKEEARNTLKQAFFEFNLAEEENRGKKNIFQIAKAASEGRVKKLIIADKFNVFGKIDRKTGELQIHPFDLDHEDDDILDDLAQTVLALGGEVIVASREEIPKGRPILAILDGNNKDIEKNIVSNSLDDKESLNEKNYFF